MPSDPHLFPGERERFRRYGRFLIHPIRQSFEIFEHDLFFQDKKFDQLYGDIHRSFAPMVTADYENPFLQMLMIESFRSLPLAESLRRVPFEISAHMIRISATPTSMVGRPAPEGIHRDGYHFGSIHLMRRENVKGAENQIYDLKKNLIHQMRLEEPMDSIFFDDAAIYHAVSAFEPEDTTKTATRDMLILLYQPIDESPQKPTPTRFLRRL